VRFEGGIEPSRGEFFIEGTEPMDAVRVQAAHEKPRIVYPPEGTLITIDPDIPGKLQRGAMRFEPSSARVRWVLDDSEAESDRPLFLWEPRRGSHTLSIVDADGRVVDSVGFTVR
jgi:penicillin-binding protein 1C